MAKKKSGSKKGSSADDIIEQLAQEMGVEGADEDETETEEEEEVAADDSEGDVELEDDEPTPSPDQPAAEEPAGRPPITNDEAIEQIFSGKGEETKPGNVPAEYDIETFRKPASPLPFIITLLLGAGIAAAVWFMVPETYRECLDKEINVGAGACRTWYEAFEDERLEQERLEFLANAPKYGSLTVITVPKNLPILAEGHETWVMPGTRTDLTTQVRTRYGLSNIPVDSDFTFTIDGGGVFENLEVTVPTFDDTESPWVQDPFTGDYFAELTFIACYPGQPNWGGSNCLTPVMGEDNVLARELQWRLDPNRAPRPEDTLEEGEHESRLYGSITVNSDPAGAFIAYNGVQLYDPETMEPVTTPYTFDAYPPRADQAVAILEGENPEELTMEDLMTQVYLSNEGLPLNVIKEGKLEASIGVYAQNFVCTPRDGADAPPAEAEGPPNFYDFCDYSFEVTMVLSDPPPPEEEGSGEETEEE